MLGLRQSVLQHLGSCGRALLYRLNHEPLHHLHRQVHRSEVLLKVSHHHDGEKSRGHSSGGLAILHGDLNRATSGVERTAASGRQHLQHHRGAWLRSLLLAVFFLPPAHGHPGDVFQGVRGGQEDYQESRSGSQAGEKQVNGGGAAHPLPERPGGIGGEREEQKPPVSELRLGAPDEILPRKKGCQDAGHRGRGVHPLLVTLLLRFASGYVTLSFECMFALMCIIWIGAP